jgi:GlcNAc-P-P-Und epimerase
MQEIDYLLTGSSGFFGQVIKKTLLPDYSLYTLGRSPSSDCITNLATEVPPLKNDLHIKCVIHAAGKAHVIPKNENEAREFFNVNFQGTVHLTQALEKLNRLPESFVFISTVAVYGSDEGTSISEEHPLNGNTPYAKSKMEAEAFLIKWCDQKQVRLTILRLPLLVGPNPPGNLGAILRFIRKGLYVGIGAGHAKKSMVLTEDVVRFIPLVSKVGGIFNLTDGHHPSMVEIENAIAQEMGKRSPRRLPEGLIKLVAQTGDVLGSWFPLNSLRYQKLTSSLTFSDAKARQLAGWNPRPVLHNLPFEK